MISWTVPLNRSVSNSIFIQTKGAWSQTIVENYGAAIISDIECINQ